MLLPRTKPRCRGARPRTFTAPAPKPTREVEPCRESRLSEAELPQDQLPIAVPRVRSASCRGRAKIVIWRRCLATTVRETRPNTRIKPRREAASA